ncbi:MAG TPA: choice-of-anchor D domain-containing protein, partial [Polyangia bacterium]|nr:choice-of-anchor D domain-containing protein [Polyangia bacterium]
KPALFDVTNTGGKASGELTVDINGNDSYAFTIANDTCSHQVIAQGASCQLAVTLTSPLVGALEADLRVTGDPGGIAKVHLHGNVSVTTLVITPVDFGGVAQGTSSKPVIVTVTNGGGAASGPLFVTPPSNVEVFVGQNTCNGKSLDSGDSCTVQLTYEPTYDETAPLMDTLSVSSPNAGKVTTTVTGEPQTSATVSITDRDFGDYGMTYGPFVAQTLTASNIGTTASTVAYVELDSTSTFQISADHCTGQVLAVGGSCSVDVVPVAQIFPGKTTDTLYVTLQDSHIGSAQLTGNAVVDYIDTNITIYASGTVSSSDGQACYASPCTFRWPQNSGPVTITAMPSIAPFTEWMGTYCNASTSPSCTFTPTPGGVMTAYF